MPQKLLEPLPQLRPQTPKNKLSKAEKRRLQDLLIYEIAAQQQGHTVIAGVDEAGRGPLAGPVVAAACIIPMDLLIAGIDDSKKLSPKKRQSLFEQLTKDHRIYFGVGIVSHEEIDRINILQASIQAMLLAVAQLTNKPTYLLVDGLKLPHPTIPSEKILQGDQRSYNIAAASIIAKETRDRLMEEEHKKWPDYGFDKNKGYGTEYHLAALAKHGPCPIHRRSFEPVKGNRVKDEG